MTRIFSLVVAVVFVCSATGYSFAAEQKAPSVEQQKIEETAPTIEETKAPEEKQDVQQETQKTGTEQQGEQPTAEK